VGLRIQDGTTGFTDSDGLYLGRSGAINYLWTYENEPLVFATNNIERVRLDPNGNFGIGTNNPIAPLDVATSTNSISARIRTTSTSASSDVGLRIQDGTTGTGTQDGLYLGRASAINYLWTYEAEPLVFGTSNSERMRLFANGNLALNTSTDAGFRLDVNGTARVQGQLEVQSSNASQGILLKHSFATTATQIYYFPTDAVTYFDALFNYTASSNFGSYNFRSRDSSNALTSRLFIRGWDGSIGIGTTTPTSTLDVIGTGRFGPSPSQFGSLLSIRGNFNSLEFGTNNNAGFGSVLGTTNNSGRPFLAFNGSRGTVTNNTFLSSGIRSSILISDLLGGMIIGTVANANADNQSLINLVTITPTLTTILTQLNTTASITAASAIARGVFFNNTLVAAANNDVLVGLDINPTFTNGAFTGVGNYGLRTSGWLNFNTGASLGLVFGSSITWSGGVPTNGLQIINGGIYYNGAGAGFFHTFRTNVNNSTGNRLVIGDSTVQVLNTNLLVNTTTDAGFRLDVNGTARVQNTFSALSSSTNGIVLDNTSNNPSVAFWAGIQRITLTRENNDGLSFNASGFAMHVVNAGTLIGGANRFDLVGSAQLQVNSTTKGFLPPRMTTTQKNAISSPATGLVVYDTTLSGIALYNGTNWQNVLVPNSNNNVLIGTTTDNGQGTLQNTGSAFLGGLQVGGLTFSTSTTATTSTVFYYFNGGSGQTLTLPSTVGISSYFLIKNAGTAALTISRSGSTDTIMAPNGTSTSTTISLAVGSQAILVSNGAFVWIQIV
jgi:hypothetical protein